ncbi:MAG: alkaline phosphatase family protein [candidate division KSB1 bacterium]|jgi:predicted AlkP superfamily phosphohydrolase/phosphomutase|nr:alkaline phosphatase family protein [candidate division KSB1 bacterium]
MNRKTVMIGLDGATWKIIHPLVSEGKLPHMKRLMDEGTHGILMSDEKMVSPSVWTTILTGQVPQKHGILDFMTMQNKLKSKRLWNIYEDHGMSIGISGFLMTWPPRVKNHGFMIPDHFAPDTQTIPDDVSFLRELTNTRHLKQNLSPGKMMEFYSKSRQYNIDFASLIKAFRVFLEKRSSRSTYLDTFHKEINIFMLFLERVFTTLVKSYKPDLAAIYLAGTDVLAHKYWHFFKPEDFEDVEKAMIRKFGNVIPDVYIASDRIIGRILKAYDAMYGDYDVVVVSDHGFQTYHDRKFRPSVKIEYVLNKTGMNARFNYTKVGHMAIVTPKADSAELEQTYLKELEEKLAQIQFVKDNTAVLETDITENYMKISAQPYWKGYQFDDDIVINSEPGKVDNVIDKGVLITGTHEREGIIIAAGKNIKQGFELDGGEVYDVTPTMLAMQGLPIAKDMDGKVLEAIFKDGFLKDQPLQYTDTYGAPEGLGFSEQESEAVKENEEILISKLRSLGYME